MLICKVSNSFSLTLITSPNARFEKCPLYLRICSIALFRPYIIPWNNYWRIALHKKRFPWFERWGQPTLSKIRHSTLLKSKSSEWPLTLWLKKNVFSPEIIIFDHTVKYSGDRNVPSWKSSYFKFKDNNFWRLSEKYLSRKAFSFMMAGIWEEIAYVIITDAWMQQKWRMFLFS